MNQFIIVDSAAVEEKQHPPDFFLSFIDIDLVILFEQVLSYNNNNKMNKMEIKTLIFLSSCCCCCVSLHKVILNPFTTVQKYKNLRRLPATVFQAKEIITRREEVLGRSQQRELCVEPIKIDGTRIVEEREEELKRWKLGSCSSSDVCLGSGSQQETVSNATAANGLAFPASLTTWKGLGHFLSFSLSINMEIYKTCLFLLL